MSLYEYKYDLTEEKREDVEFSIEIIATIDDFKIEKKKYKSYPVSILDEITTRPLLLDTKPCKLSCSETYKIIREYIKTNIDHNWATIHSDYDFCFSVEKLIVLDEPEKYSVDINNMNFFSNRKRKPKYETRYRKYRNIKIFEMAPSSYQSYPVVKPFVGENYDDLVKNIEEYLSKLMPKINEPLIDCPHCKGAGVILEEE